MSVLDRLRTLRREAENLASELPTEEMFMRFNEEIVYMIDIYIRKLAEAEG